MFPVQQMMWRREQPVGSLQSRCSTAIWTNSLFLRKSTYRAGSSGRYLSLGLKYNLEMKTGRYSPLDDIRHLGVPPPPGHLPRCPLLVVLDAGVCPRVQQEQGRLLRPHQGRHVQRRPSVCQPGLVNVRPWKRSRIRRTVAKIPAGIPALSRSGTSWTAWQ